MTEIFTNINNETKQLAYLIWHTAIMNKDPASAAKFILNITNYFKQLMTEEEIEFLQFYFNTQLEMMKK